MPKILGVIPRQTTGVVLLIWGVVVIFATVMMYLTGEEVTIPVLLGTIAFVGIQFTGAYYLLRGRK